MNLNAISQRVTPEQWTTAFDGWLPSLLQQDPFQKRHNLYFLLFALSAVLSSYGRSVGTEASTISAIAALLGSVTCGWGWLFARSLFVPAQEDTNAPIMAVLLVLLLQFAGSAGLALGDDAADILRVAGNIVAMVGSTFVIVTLVEIVRHIPGTPNGAERRFRQIFSAGYLTLVIAAVFIVDGAREGSFLALHSNSIESAAAITAMAGAATALRFRNRHPLPENANSEEPAQPAEAPTHSEWELATRVDDLMRTPEFYTRPSLKVADVAAQLGTRDYLVSRVISKVLKQPNFNRYVNRLRVEHAKKMLRDPELRGTSILVIALDCGFASLGPFNRAFRDETGMSPSDYRRRNATPGGPG